MKILVVLLSSFLIHAAAEANCPPWQPCRKGRISGDGGYAGAVAAAIEGAEVRPAPAMRFEKLDSPEPQPSRGAVYGGASQTGSNSSITPSTSGLAVMEFDRQSSIGRSFEANQRIGAAQFRQGGGIGGMGGVAGADGGDGSSGSVATGNAGLAVMEFGRQSSFGPRTDANQSAGGAQDRQGDGDGSSGSVTTGNAGLASLQAIASSRDSDQWRWTGRLVTGRQAQVVKDLIFKRYLDGNFRSDAIRVNYWQILGEAVDLAKSQVAVIDALDHWKLRFELSEDDESIWNILYAAGAVSKASTAR